MALQAHWDGAEGSRCCATSWVGVNQSIKNTSEAVNKIIAGACLTTANVYTHTFVCVCVVVMVYPLIGAVAWRYVTHCANTPVLTSPGRIKRNCISHLEGPTHNLVFEHVIDCVQICWYRIILGVRFDLFIYEGCAHVQCVLKCHIFKL